MSRLLTAGVAAAAAHAVTLAARAGRLPGGSARWARTNYRGNPVTLTGGVALAVGTAVPLVARDPAAALVVTGCAAAGAVDDLAGAGAAKGLRGHLTALRRGRVTTGAVKVAALVVSGLAGCALSDRRAGRPVGVHTLSGGALVAGSANLANLFDLRPGRALKVALGCAVPLALSGRPAAAAVVGSGTALLPADLRGTSMLGDTGANPLGAAVGLAAAQALGPGGRAAALLLVTALVLASERISFSRVIDAHPMLRALDLWGRRP